MQSERKRPPAPRRPVARALLLLFAVALVPHARAGGPLGIDHEWALDQSGAWAQKYQSVLEYGAVAAELGGGIWFGKDDPLGRTFWQSVDSTAVSAVSAEILKLAFSRARPNQGLGPGKWFQGSCCDSFPSGEVTVQASFVTPFIVNYARAHPWVWALEALPLYVGIARLKNQAHWQSDVLAGWALGSGLGYWSTTRDMPLSVQILPHGLTVGISRSY
ncbi:MAG TPA: phosphatase PAP2 family protein [Steroidobacteraceae bacterium]